MELKPTNLKILGLLVVVLSAMVDVSRSADVNLLLNKPAFQQTTAWYGGTPMDAYKANDDIVTTDLHGTRECSHTYAAVNGNKSPLMSWWAVDMGSEVLVDRVVITPRQGIYHCYICQKYLADSYIGVTNVNPEISSIHPANLSICGYLSGPTPMGEPTEIICRYTMKKGRYLVVQHSHDNMYMSICNIEAYKRSESYLPRYKPAFQYPDNATSPASLANNGIDDEVDCAQTGVPASGSKAWWAVDLGQEVILEGAWVFAERPSDGANISLAMTNSNPQLISPNTAIFSVCLHDHLYRPTLSQFYCNAAEKGRYLIIRNSGPSYLRVCAVFDIKSGESACAPNCLNCSINGYEKCDPGQCKKGYIFDTVTKFCLAQCTAKPHNGACQHDNSSPITMWYYDTNDNTCKQFQWSGCDRQDNNFDLEEMCIDTCVGATGLPKSNSSKCQGDAHIGSCVEHERGEDGTITRWTFDYPCKQIQWDGCARMPNNFHAKEPCEEMCVNNWSDDAECYVSYTGSSCKPQPLETGNITQWYYDIATDTCKTFEWSGCDRGANNFDLKDECVSSCVGKGSSGGLSCEDAPNIGSCGPYERGESGPIKQWYYDSVSNTCKTFLWSGCERQFNNFDLKDDCEDDCVGPYGQKTNSDNCYGRPYPGTCQKKKDVLHIQNWYYDSSSNECRNFSWSGCDRKPNNFDLLEDCTELCVGTNGPKSTSPRCQGEPHVGECVRYERGEDGPIIRWYYDSATESCKQFQWSGCNRQENNFDTEVDCVNAANTLGFITSHVLTTNVALNQPSFHSCTYLTSFTNFHPASKANDNYTGAYMEAPPYPCSVSDVICNTTNWWAVDLGEVMSISSVKISGRSDKRPEQTQEFFVGLTNVNPDVTAPTLGSYSQCAYQDGPVGLGRTIELKCDKSTQPGRYLVIQQKYHDKYFSLCNVEAYQLLRLDGSHLSPVTDCQQGDQLGDCPKYQPYPITQWYYNETTRSCEPFDWYGCYRQQNNFDYKEACEATCM